MNWFGKLFGGGDSGRDGSSPDKAIAVQSVSEEYDWMYRHCPGFRPQQQMLQDIGGKPFDVLVWQNDQGEERTVYFDISSFYGQ